MSGSDSDSEPDVEGLKEVGKLIIEIHPTDDKASVPFKVVPTTKFSRMFTAYEDKVNVQKGAYKYTYDGNRIHRDDNTTPKMLEFKIGKQYVVDAHLEQLGGSTG
ncbi:uncharacterized protein L199_003735 [Kwoniella botswanensis]|uniref:uncharacterized protein n=1 Tax=Kwoniella botswanensis TaxID=1268659 RepID=UPI00315CF037